MAAKGGGSAGGGGGCGGVAARCWDGRAAGGARPEGAERRRCAGASTGHRCWHGRCGRQVAGLVGWFRPPRPTVRVGGRASRTVPRRSGRHDSAGAGGGGGGGGEAVCAATRFAVPWRGGAWPTGGRCAAATLASLTGSADLGPCRLVPSVIALRRPCSCRGRGRCSRRGTPTTAGTSAVVASRPRATTSCTPSSPLWRPSAEGHERRRRVWL